MNMNMNTNIKKLWDKIELNSCYYPYDTPTFTLYDESKSNNVTECGKIYLNTISDLINNNLN